MNNIVHQSLFEQMRITEHDIERRKIFMSFTDKDVQLLKSVKGFIEPYIPSIVNHFYELQTEIPEIALVIGDRETLNNLHMSLNRYVLELFMGNYDMPYVEKRLRIGKVHHRIGVPPKLYFSGMNQLQMLLGDAFEELAAENEKINANLLKQALQKLLYFDNQFVQDTYISALQGQVESANQQLEIYASNLEKKVFDRTQELVELSTKDPLTNLYNQRAFYEELEKGIGLAERTEVPMTLLYIDVNKFKEINDEFGHKVGDEILVSVATAIANTIRKQESAARYGGDEFCVILPNTSSHNVSYYCERLFAEFDSLKVMPVTLSVGAAEVSMYTGFDSDQLIIRADKQMYIAKQAAHETKQNQLRVEIPEYNETVDLDEKEKV